MKEAKPLWQFLVGERIDPESVRKVTGSLQYGQPTVLVIDSTGGDIGAGNILAAIIQQNTKVTGLVIGQAASMAVAVFQACHWRVMLEGTTLFFHPAQYKRPWETAEIFSEDRIQRIIQEWRVIDTWYEHLILQRAENTPSAQPLTQELLRSWRLQGKRLSAHEAHAWGLADRVLNLSELVNLPLLLPEQA